MNSERRAFRVIVNGRVQGVGFRWATMHAASRCGATGWVRNRADGSVEAHVEGTAPALASMREFFAQGPPGARVETADWTEITDFEVDGGFRIRSDL